MNWEQRLKMAEKRKRFTRGDRRLVNGYETCAVGELWGSVEAIIRKRRQTKLETVLWNLDADFYDAVQFDQVEVAKTLYRHIRRVAEVVPKPRGAKAPSPPSGAMA